MIVFSFYTRQKQVYDSQTNNLYHTNETANSSPTLIYYSRKLRLLQRRQSLVGKVYNFANIAVQNTIGNKSREVKSAKHQ